MKIEMLLTEKLLKDRKESLADIEICKNALILNITTYSRGSVQERLEVNQKIVKQINEELGRRWR